ncbi:MAG TPA: J domain-containing protein [Anaeromyxobacter sp.]|nr:J domain-containing protein [Anaeromyxobacter sp.]
MPVAPGRELARRDALARTRAPEPSGGDEVAALEARLRGVLDEVTALDVEIEKLSAALADFSRAWEHQLGRAFAERAVAERLVRRLTGLEDALFEESNRVRAAEPQPRRRRAQRRTRHASAARRARAAWDPAPEPHDGWPEAGGPDPGTAEAAQAAPEPEVEAREVSLKRTYRRLARLLHPDLAQDDGERARLSDLMARVNAAYARGDLTELSVLSERLGAGEPLGELTDDERRAHLQARVANLERIAASLRRERDRLLRSDTERLRTESARRAEAGGDLVEETRVELAEETAAAYGDALARLERLGKAARELARARKARMRELEKRGPTGAKRAFDPLAESELVRRGAARLEERRATAAARELARALEDQARAALWEVALTCLAFFAEAAGTRPPDVLATAEGWTAVWDAVRAEWPGAPELPRALARLPRHLTLGARQDGDEVLAGMQLASADLAAGVQMALDRPAVARVGAAVLAALGPVETCPACRAAGPARHLHRTRGLDTLHGLVCAACGAVLRSYWRYGEVDGLEALAPHALRLGLVAEVTAALAGTTLGFQLLPAEAEALTAEKLRRRFADLYLTPYDVALAPAAVQVLGEEGPLGPGARLEGRGRLELAPAPDAGVTGPELLELLRARIERRFRP